ncbi:hypothetical protein L596_002215 [Steinernema carpocapsae]|uniref:Uncharacterized protein n=1 Tax=Steinernema carpocapsae TaxID=34508 RepID=A0A4U8UNY0_STECR|nr:hypothetical protein L596_002215 [Steinernema carpocapsae]
MDLRPVEDKPENGAMTRNQSPYFIVVVFGRPFLQHFVVNEVDCGGKGRFIGTTDSLFDTILFDTILRHNLSRAHLRFNLYIKTDVGSDVTAPTDNRNSDHAPNLSLFINN